MAKTVLEGAVWNTGAPAQADLPEISIYVPSISAVQPLKLAFLSLARRKATLLPRIRVLGESEPLDIFAAFGRHLELFDDAKSLLTEMLRGAPALSGIEQRIVLTDAVLRGSQSVAGDEGETVFLNMLPQGAFSFAGKISSLLDEASDEDVEVDRVTSLQGGDAAESAALPYQLLCNAIRDFQSFTAKAGKQTAAGRRKILMAFEADFIRRCDAPVIIAGSTGSVSGTVRLMQATLSRPNGALILPGLDRHLDDDSWSTLADHPGHPQAGLHRLLTSLNVPRSAVRDIGAGSPRPSRSRFVSEAMRPAPATTRWRSFIDEHTGEERDIVDRGLSLVEAETLQEEAEIAALILRASLENPERCAALVTPDETISRRVRSVLTHWGLLETEPAALRDADVFACRVASCAALGRAEDFVALLRHAPGYSARRFQQYAAVIDLGLMRQIWRPSSLGTFGAAFAHAASAMANGEIRSSSLKRLARSNFEEAGAFCQEALAALNPLLSGTGKQRAFAGWVAAHIETMAAFSELGLTAPMAPPFLEAALPAAPHIKKPMTLQDYAALIGLVEAEGRVPPLHDPHPGLHFWTPLDARLQSVDTVVLAGLNEGCWPQSPTFDPWFNSEQRAMLGLAPLERRLGQSAHDFESLALAPSVYLTRSKTLNGSLARPSRWISRMKALASGAAQPGALSPENPWAEWVRMRRMPDAVTPATQPEPRPPLSARPRRLSVTAIETWFANPYAIYARHILKLDAVRGLHERFDARDKGILLHAALHRFHLDYPGSLPENGASALTARLTHAADAAGFDLSNAPFWRPRFEQFADWYLKTESDRRTNAIRIQSECGGRLEIAASGGPFTVTARADRIDLMQNGSVHIYDFKTSQNAVTSSLNRGAPQLALEGLLAREGAFDGVPQSAAPGLFYIAVTGGEPAGSVCPPKGRADDAIQSAYVGLVSRIARFDDVTAPYTFDLRTMFKDKLENDPYAHLARVKEWSAGSSGVEACDD